MIDVLSKEYLEWMKNETKNKTIYFPQLISFNENICYIEDLYNRLKEYQNNYYALYKNDSDIIIFKYDDINYEIGCIYGHERLFYIKVTNKNSMFDINNVKDNTTNNDEVSSRLLIINKAIKELMNIGIDESLINNQVKIYTKKPIN